MTAPYKVSGSGPTLVLSHGVIENSQSWEDAVPLLERSFTVVTYDARGRGRNTGPAPFGYKELADDVDALVTGLGVERFFHAGHSMGGRVALEHALAYPDRLAGVAVISARAGAPDAGDRKRLQGLVATTKKGGPGEAVAMWASETSQHYERVRSICANNPLEGTVAALEALISARSLAPRLKQLRVPTLVVAGACDESYGRYAAEMAEEIPKGQLCILEGIGHFPNIECPDLLAAELTTFFSAIDSRDMGRF
jgi:pimeloyl-ACP methyl ester carboxylesterase